MRGLVALRAEHGDALAATLRERFGVSLWDVGTLVTWGEVLALVRVAMSDPSTYLGAEVRGFSYPASMAEMVQISGMFGKSAKRVLPFDPDTLEREAQRPTDTEVARAEAEAAEEIIFS
jgi:hypothetical protein